MLNKTQLLPDRPGIPPMAKLPDPEVIDPAALSAAYARGETDLICVVGPTASGKTRYAVQLAKALAPAEILSADSRQVYTGMDIGKYLPVSGGVRQGLCRCPEPRRHPHPLRRIRPVHRIRHPGVQV